MQRLPNDRLPPLEYSSPSRDRVTTRLDVLAGLALTVGVLSLVTAGVPDRGGMRYWLQVNVGIFGGTLGLLLGIAAIARLLWLRRIATSNIAVTAAGMACAAFAIAAGLRLYWR
jgi:hypothetical protein